MAWSSLKMKLPFSPSKLKVTWPPKKIALVGAGSLAVAAVGKHLSGDSFYAPPWMNAKFEEKKAAFKSLFAGKTAE